MTFLYDGKLNALDTTMAKKIEAKPSIITTNNIFDAAENLGVSASKLTKYCQKINLKGFKEMKYRLIQELQHERYFQHTTSILRIEDLIKKESYQKLFELPDIINNSRKLIILVNEDDLYFGQHVVNIFRRKLAVNAVVYSFSQTVSHEYLENEVVTILIDRKQTLSSLSKDIYRIGNKYVHITEKTLHIKQGYHPIITIDTEEADTSFDVIVLLIFDWLFKQIKK